MIVLLGAYAIRQVWCTLGADRFDDRMKLEYPNSFNQSQKAYLDSYLKFKGICEADFSALIGFLTNDQFGEYFRSLTFYEPPDVDKDYEQSTKFDSTDSWGIDFLEHFTLLSDCREIVVSEKTNPLLAVSEIQNWVGRKDNWGAPTYRYFYGTLVDFLETEKTFADDADFKNCCSYVRAMLEALTPAFNQSRDMVRHSVWNSPHFDITKVYLQSLPNLSSKIRHLRELSIECEAYHNEQELDTCYSDGQEGKEDIEMREAFLRLCDINIKKFEKLLELETLEGEVHEPSVTDDVSPNFIKSKLGKIREEHKHFTLDRMIFLFNRIIPNFEKIDATKKGEFISFLTGLDATGSAKRFGSIHRKDGEKEDLFFIDMKIVRNYLDLLGYDDKVKQLDNDLRE